MRIKYKIQDISLVPFFSCDIRKKTVWSGESKTLYGTFWARVKLALDFLGVTKGISIF